MSFWEGVPVSKPVLFECYCSVYYSFMAFCHNSAGSCFCAANNEYSWFILETVMTCNNTSAQTGKPPLLYNVLHCSLGLQTGVRLNFHAYSVYECARVYEKLASRRSVNESAKNGRHNSSAAVMYFSVSLGWRQELPLTSRESR